MQFSIEADGLEKTFGGKHQVRALDGVSFTVAEGTVFGLLGPNGSGKTTAVRILTTIIKPDGGAARVLGHDVTKKPALVRSLIGLAGQYAAVDENLTGRENLQMVGNLNHLAKASVSGRARDLLAQFGLTDAGDRPLKTYSGGMRRRLDLAAALVARPRVLFLDEPTTGLDPRTRMQMWESIRRLVSSGSTILLTTQYLDEADQLADRIALIDHGRVVAEGTPRELKAAIGRATLHLQLADEKDAAEAIRVTQNVLNVKASTPERTLVTAPMADPDRLTDLLVSLREAKIHLATVSVQEPTLDEVFLALTGDGKQTEKGATTP